MAENRPDYQIENGSVPGMRFALKRTRVARFTLANGCQAQWEGIESGITVLVLGLTRKGNLVLVRLFRYMVEDWVYEMPGGCAEAGEGFLAASLREFCEETGYAAEKVVPLGWTYLDNGVHNGRGIIFLATGCHKVADVELDRVEAHAQLRVEEVPLLTVLRNLRDGHPEFTDPNLGDAILKGLMHLPKWQLISLLGRSLLTHLRSFL